MKVLVTGATGFTGKVVAQKLLDKDFEVRVLVRNRKKLSLENVNKLEVFEGDLTSKTDVEKAVDGVERIYNVAAVFREGGLTDEVYWDVHVNSTKYLLDASVKYGVKKFIHCSTGGVHGHIENPPADENYRFGPGDVYQITKLEGEKLALKYQKENEIDVVIIRPTPIYGEGDLRLKKLFKLALRRPSVILGNGKMYYHLVHVSDLADGILMAAEKENISGEVFIIGGDEVLTLKEIIKLIQKVNNQDNYILKLPAWPIQLLGSVCEKIFIPLKIDPPIYRRRVDFFTKSRYFDIKKAKKILGYSPKIGIEEGIKRTSEWYKKEKLL